MCMSRSGRQTKVQVLLIVMEKFTYGIDFIEDSVLESLLSSLLGRVAAAKQKNNPHKNIIDPFTAMFQATSLQISIDDWFPTEENRQINKSISNAVGDLHQELIGQLPGWRSTGRNGGVVDLVHEAPYGPNNQPVLAEVKNKFNTMNAGAQEKLYDNLQNALGWPTYKNYSGYLIQIIQRKPSGDVPWWPSKRAERDDIRRIGAKQVYADATGNPEAFTELFLAIRKVLQQHHGLNFSSDDDLMIMALFDRAF